VSRFYRKIGSWLGLFAILMATLAPTITHTLAARSDASALSGEFCSVLPTASSASSASKYALQNAALYAALAASGAHHHAAGEFTQHTQPTQHPEMSDGDACGYCSLLAHMPVMPSVEGLFLVAVRVSQHIAASRFESVRRVEPLTFGQPRAPPFPS
jgi:hypothetical protein